jgi:hypothetical protein
MFRTRRVGPVWAFSALATGSLGRSGSAARIHISGGQHAQQRRTAAGTTRVDTPAHSRDGSGPFEPFMHRCCFLRFRFAHRTKTPTRRNATQKSRSTLRHSIGPRGTRIPPGKGRPGIFDNAIRRKTGLSPPRIISRDNRAFQQPASRMHARLSQRPEQSLEAALNAKPGLYVIG